MADGTAWSGTVVKMSHGLLDGSNMYRRVVVRTDAGATQEIRVGRDLWRQMKVGDRLVKEPGHDVRRVDESKES